MPEEFALGTQLSWYNACLASWKPWVLYPASYRLGVVLNTCNPSTWEVEAGGVGAQGHPQLHIQFQHGIHETLSIKKKKKKPV